LDEIVCDAVVASERKVLLAQPAVLFSKNKSAPDISHQPSATSQTNRLQVRRGEERKSRGVASRDRGEAGPAATTTGGMKSIRTDSQCYFYFKILVKCMCGTCIFKMYN
jgi:hypothetical protein